MLNRIRFVLITVVLAVFASAALAQPKPRILDKETFFQMESIANPVIAPDGSQIVFTRGFVDGKKDQNASSLWIVDARGAVQDNARQSIQKHRVIKLFVT